MIKVRSHWVPGHLSSSPWFSCTTDQPCSPPPLLMAENLTGQCPFLWVFSAQGRMDSSTSALCPPSWPGVVPTATCPFCHETTRGRGEAVDPPRVLGPRLISFVPSCYHDTLGSESQTRLNFSFDEGSGSHSS